MEASEQIGEVAEEMSDSEESRFRGRVALLIAILAMLLAVNSLGAGNVTDDLIDTNIQASNTWAFYQAKNIRQTTNEIAADAMEAQLAVHGDRISPAARAEMEKKIAGYRATAERYESEPDPEDPSNPLKGEGKKQLSARARDWEKKRERASEQDKSFDYGEAFFQIAIVLGSVAILANSRRIVWLSLGTGLIATLLMLNGYFLFFGLPF